MKSLLLFLCLFCLIAVVSTIFEGEGSKRKRFSSSSSFSDEDSSYEGRKKKKKHHHHGRPPIQGDGHGGGGGNGGGGRACPSDWMTFDRPQGRWCVKLFIGNLGNMLAEGQCRLVNATLTGLQTDAERLKLAEAGRTIMLQNNYGDAAIWLGAHRKGSCPTANMCFPKETFFWTDNHTIGNEGFGWATGQPDADRLASATAWGVQSCVHQFIFSSGSTNAKWPGYMHGQLDDMYCQVGDNSPSTKMYACGRKP